MIGTVEDQHTVMVDPSRKIIATLSEISVEYVMSGNLSTNESIIVEILGGKIGDLSLWVSDQPRIEIGEKGIFFLNFDSGTARYKVNGLVQGKYTLEEDWVKEVDAHISDFVGMMKGFLPVSEGPGVRACTVGNLGISWPGSSAGMYWNRNGTGDCPGEAKAVKKSYRAWNNVSGSSFTFSVSGRNTGTGPSYDGKNQLWFSNASGYVAATYYWSSGSTYKECDLNFNDSYTWNSAKSCPSNEMDVRNIATHELGHCWGADDEYGSSCSSATMYGYVNYGETKKRTLTSDDEAAIKNLY